MQLNKLCKIAEEVVTHVVPRFSPSSHIRFDVWFPSKGVSVPFVVYRPHNYTSVFVASDLIDDHYIRNDRREHVDGWHEIKDHDSCWTDWHNAFAHEKGVDLLTEAEVERVRVWHKPDPESGTFDWMLVPKGDWRRAEKEDPPTFDWHANESVGNRTVKAYPEWVACYLSIVARYWARMGKPLGTLEHEFRKGYPSRNHRFLKWDIDADGVPTLTGMKTAFRGEYRHAKGTGSFVGDVEKFIRKAWKSEDFSDGVFMPKVENTPTKHWGM